MTSIPPQSPPLVRRAPGGWLVAERGGAETASRLQYRYSGEDCLHALSPEERHWWSSLCRAWSGELCRRQQLGDCVDELGAEVGLRQLLAAARAQRLDAVVATFVGELLGAARAPVFIGREAANAHRRAVEHTLRVDAEALGLLEALEDAGTEPVVLKGMAFAARDYPDPSLRIHHDLDVLVRADRLQVAESCLKQLGGIRRFAERVPGFDRRFSKGFSVRVPGPVSIEVDVHRTLADGPFGMRVDAQQLVGHCDWFTVAGVRLRTLPEPARFVHACLHAVLGRPGFPLAPLLDVAVMMARADCQAEEVIRLAEAWDCEAVVSTALAAVAAIVGGVPAVGVDELGAPALQLWASEVQTSKHRRVVRQRRWIDLMVDKRHRRLHRHLATAAAIDGWVRKAQYLSAVGWSRRQSVSNQVRRHLENGYRSRADSTVPGFKDERSRGTSRQVTSVSSDQIRLCAAAVTESVWVEDHLLVREVTNNRIHLLSMPVATVFEFTTARGESGVNVQELGALFREISGLSADDAHESLNTSVELLRRAGLIQVIEPGTAGPFARHTTRHPCLGCGDQALGGHTGAADEMADDTSHRPCLGCGDQAAPTDGLTTDHRSGQIATGRASPVEFPVGPAFVRVHTRSAHIMALVRWWAEPLSVAAPSGDHSGGRPALQLPDVEFAIDDERALVFLPARCNRVASAVDDGLALHAAACALDSVGVVIAGRSGAGKSTLVAALVGRGATYLTDEICVVTTEDQTLRPYPKRLELDGFARGILGLDDGELLEPLHDLFQGDSPIQEWACANVDPRQLGSALLPGGSVFRLRVIVHPVISSTPGPARLRKLPAPAAALVMSRAVLNFDRLGQRGLEQLAYLLQEMPVYQLQFSDLDDACGLLEQLIARLGVDDLGASGIPQER